MKRTIVSRVLATVILFMLPFIFAWALIIGSGFILTPQQTFNSGGFWIPSAFYWIGWGIWQITSAIDRQQKREKMEKLAEEHLKRFLSESSASRQKPELVKEFEVLLRSKRN